jgi:hypothetical protein
MKKIYHKTKQINVNFRLGFLTGLCGIRIWIYLLKGRIRSKIHQIRNTRIKVYEVYRDANGGKYWQKRLMGVSNTYVQRKGKRYLQVVCFNF